MRKTTNMIAAFLAVAIFAIQFGQAQTLDELKAQKAEKAAAKAEVDAQAAAIAGEIAAIDAEIAKFPTWTKGFTGLLGLDLNGSNNWYTNPVADFTSTGIGVNFAAFANYSADKNFWFNNLNANYAYTRVNNTVDGVDETLTTEASPLTIGSLGGWAISGPLFVSGKLGFETNFLNINEYNKFSASAGLTWKPISNLVVFVHPLAFQLINPDATFSSSAGADFGATYAATLGKVKWSSNLNGFLSYSGDDAKNLTASELSNWTWINGFVIDDLFKGIGVGLNVGLRGNKQLALANGETDNPLQTYYTLGFSYAL